MPLYYIALLLSVVVYEFDKKRIAPRGTFTHTYSAELEVECQGMGGENYQSPEQAMPDQAGWRGNLPTRKKQPESVFDEHRQLAKPKEQSEKDLLQKMEGVGQ